MKPVTPYQWSAALLMPLLIGGVCPAVQAQISVPVGDRTGTIVNQNGNTFDITGGTQAGANLFHSLQQFGLNQGQIANFLSHAAVQNILARVTGGQTSVINGLVRVTGGNANLYLMNPAGIVFGTNARLDVPGSFTATTANGIGFGQAGWDASSFNATGENNYATLTGTPTTFAFNALQPGAIINAGSLAVGSGQSLTLLGGTVINTGSLTAPDGTVTIAAVPGASLVRLSQAGSLLSLEISPLVPAAVPTVPTVAELLTGGSLTHATGLTVNPDGTVQLGSQSALLPTTPGTALVSGHISTVGSQSGANAQIAVVGDRVALVNANLDAAGATGGTIRIGGGYQGRGTIPNAQYAYVDPTTTLRVDGIANAQPAHAGTVILWADQATQFYGSISAQGGATAGNGGFVEVSGQQNLVFRGKVDTRAVAGNAGTLWLDPTNIEIRAGNSDDGNDNNGANPNPAFSFGNNANGDNGQVTVNDTLPTIIYESEFFDLDTTTNIVIQATENITIDPTLTNLFVGGDGSLTFTADADNNGSGNFSMAPTTQLNATGRSLTITGASVTVGTFQVRNATFTATNGNLTTGSIDASFGTAANNVTLRAPNGSVTLDGTIRSGDMLRPADSTIVIEAQRFRAINPTQVAGPNDNSSQDGPFVSLYAFPANQQDGTRTGQVTVQFTAPNADQTPIARGTGNPLIIIRLLQDTTFATGTQFNPAAAGSGVRGAIGIGVGFVPNAAILLQDNSFSATITQTPTGNGGTPGGLPAGGGRLESSSGSGPGNGTNTVGTNTAAIATVLETDQSGTETTPTCDPAAGGDDILDISDLVPGGTMPPATGTSGGNLPPCPAGAIPRR